MATSTIDWSGGLPFPIDTAPASPVQAAPAAGNSVLGVLTQLTSLGVNSYLAVSARDIQSQQIHAGQVPTSLAGLNSGNAFSVAQSLGSYSGLLVIFGVVVVIVMLLRR